MKSNSILKSRTAALAVVFFITCAGTLHAQAPCSSHTLYWAGRNSVLAHTTNLVWNTVANWSTTSATYTAATAAPDACTDVVMPLSTTAAGNRTLSLTGATAISSLTVTAALNGASFFIDAAGNSFTIANNVSLSCSSGKVLLTQESSGTITIGGTATIGAPGDAGASAIGNSDNTTAGTFIFNSDVTFNASGKINNPAYVNATFSGTALQTITGAETFNNITLNNSAGLKLASSETVNGVFTFSAGNITTTASNALVMGASATINGASATAFVNGNVSWIFSTSTSHTFPTGNGSSNYHPITFTYNSLSGTSTVTIADNESSLAATASIPSTSKLFTSRYWTISQTGGSSLNYSLQLDATGFPLLGKAVMLKSDNGGAAAQKPVIAPNYTNATAFTTMGSVNSNFALANTSIPLIINANNSSKTYGTSVTFAGTEFTTTGLQAGDAVNSVSLASTGTAATASTGNYNILASAAAGTNLDYYSISYAKGTLTVNKAALTITAFARTKIYGTSMPDSAATTYFSTAGLQNGETVDDAAITYGTGNAVTDAIGSYKLSAVPSAATGSFIASNYTITYVGGNIHVKKALLTITANNSSKNYGTLLNFTGNEFTTTGLLNSDAATSVTFVSAGAPAMAITGVYSITPSAAAGTGLTNYKIVYTNGILTVNPAAITLTITASDQNKTYGTTLSFAGTEFTATGLLNNDEITGISLTSTGTAASATAGAYNIIPGAASGTGLSNYTISYVNGTLTVVPAPLTITANDAMKCNGSTLNFAGTEFTTSGGLVNGDQLNSISLTSTGTPGTATAGAYPIIPSSASGTGLSNYNITYTNGTLTVETPVVLTMDQVNPDCYGDPGSFTSSVSGGVSPYSYKLNTGLNYDSSGAFGSNPLFSPVVPGYYAYAAEDANGCLAIAARLSVNPLTQTPILLGVNPAPGSFQICNGSKVTINTTPIGGATPYTYSLNGAPFVQSAYRYFYVPSGTYTISVKDNVGCTYTTDTVIITQSSSAVTFSTTPGGSGCNNNAIISVAASGGDGVYSYSDNGGTIYQPASSFNGLSYGSYMLTVKDNGGCTATATQLKLMPLTSSAIQGNTTVCTGSKTTISTVPTGGLIPYTYSLDGGPFVPSANRYFSAGAGSHTITVMDNGGCTYTTPAFTITSTTCPGLANAEQKTNVPMFEANISPNPSISAFHLQIKSSSREDVQITVMNMTGEKLYVTKGSVDGTYKFGDNFAAGIYLLQIKQGNSVHITKLVKSN